MLQERLYLSTISPDAAGTASEYALGLEIDEYCTALNMDEKYSETDAAVRIKLRGISRTVLHAPFNELFPCAIDPMARELAERRFIQAICIARKYGAQKVIVHGGYNPKIYYPVWYAEQSTVFWRQFMEKTDMDIVLENVLEETPTMLRDIVENVNHPRLNLCLDVGHANAYSPVPVTDWLSVCASRLCHFHIHNNDGTEDSHSALSEGSIDMASFLTAAGRLCPQSTFTLEVEHCKKAVCWLREQHLL